MQKLLIHHRQLSSLYRGQSEQARKVATLYSTLIDHRNEQSQLLEEKRQTNDRMEELIVKARERLDAIDSELPALSNAEAEARQAEVRALILQTATLFADRDRIDQRLHTLDDQIIQIEEESVVEKERFNADETLLLELKEKVDQLKATLAGPACEGEETSAATPREATEAHGES
jgi:chromosome segregation ATPase